MTHNFPTNEKTMTVKQNNIHNHSDCIAAMHPKWRLWLCPMYEPYGFDKDEAETFLCRLTQILFPFTPTKRNTNSMGIEKRQKKALRFMLLLL